MKIAFLEIMAKELLKQMPKNTFKKLAEAPEEKQAEIMGKIYDIAEDFIKKEFIKYAIEGIKEAAAHGDPIPATDSGEI